MTTKAVVVGKDSLFTLIATSLVTLLGFKLLALMFSNGDKTGVLASINQK